MPQVKRSADVDLQQGLPKELKTSILHDLKANINQILGGDEAKCEVSVERDFIRSDILHVKLVNNLFNATQQMKAETSNFFDQLVDFGTQCVQELDQQGKTFVLKLAITANQFQGFLDYIENRAAEAKANRIEREEGNNIMEI